VGKGDSSRKASINSPKKAKMRGRGTGRGDRLNLVSDDTSLSLHQID